MVESEYNRLSMVNQQENKGWSEAYISGRVSGYMGRQVLIALAGGKGGNKIMDLLRKSATNNRNVLMFVEAFDALMGRINGAVGTATAIAGGSIGTPGGHSEVPGAGNNGIPTNGRIPSDYQPGGSGGKGKATDTAKSNSQARSNRGGTTTLTQPEPLNAQAVATSASNLNAASSANTATSVTVPVITRTETMYAMRDAYDALVKAEKQLSLSKEEREKVKRWKTLLSQDRIGEKDAAIVNEMIGEASKANGILPRTTVRALPVLANQAKVSEAQRKKAEHAVAQSAPPAEHDTGKDNGKRKKQASEKHHELTKNYLKVLVHRLVVKGEVTTYPIDDEGIRRFLTELHELLQQSDAEYDEFFTAGDKGLLGFNLMPGVNRIYRSILTKIAALATKCQTDRAYYTQHEKICAVAIAIQKYYFRRGSQGSMASAIEPDDDQKKVSAVIEYLASHGKLDVDSLSYDLSTIQWLTGIMRETTLDKDDLIKLIEEEILPSTNDAETQTMFRAILSVLKNPRLLTYVEGYIIFEQGGELALLERGEDVLGAFLNYVHEEIWSDAALEEFMDFLDCLGAIDSGVSYFGSLLSEGSDKALALRAFEAWAKSEDVKNILREWSKGKDTQDHEDLAKDVFKKLSELFSKKRDALKRQYPQHEKGFENLEQWFVKVSADYLREDMRQDLPPGSN